MFLTRVEFTELVPCWLMVLPTINFPWTVLVCGDNSLFPVRFSKLQRSFVCWFPGLIKSAGCATVTDLKTG